MKNNYIKEKVKTAMLCMTRQCWEQGIAAQALLETGDMRLLSLLVRDIVLRQSEDGRLCNIENTMAITDASFCIEATLKMGELEGRTDYAEAVKKNIGFLLYDAPRSSDGVIYHMKGTREIWADSAAFTPFALCCMGYYDEAVLQMKGLKKKLYDPEKCLYYHIWDEASMGYKRKMIWAIGNGWILTGLLRLYGGLPSERTEDKSWCLSAFMELLDKVLEYETESHLFRDILDDPTSFEETESSEMIAYAIYRAADRGILDDSYIARAESIREAVYNKISEDGLLMDCASSPTFTEPGTSVEGQAHFLMMENAREQIVRTQIA